MKKTVAWILITAMVLSLAACGADPAATEKQTQPAVTETENSGSSTAKESEPSAAESETQPAGSETAASDSEAPSSENGTEPPESVPASTESPEPAGINIYDEVKDLYSSEEPRQALVQDTDLYEKMVHGRYFDLWDRRSDYSTDPAIYGFENVLTHIREDNKAAAWVADHIGAPLLDQKADRENYIRILLMLITMQAQGFAQAGNTLSDYDTLKEFPDYAEDVVSIGLDILNTADLSTAESIGFSLVGGGADLTHLTIDSLAEYEMYKDAAHNFNNAYVFLDSIGRHTDDKTLKGAVDYMLPLLMEARNRIFGGDIENYVAEAAATLFTSDLMMNTFIALLEETAEADSWAKDLLPYAKTLSEGVEHFVPGYNVAKIVYDSMILSGDMIFGTSNVYNRYAEMKCLSQIAAALRADLDDYGYAPAREEGGISKAAAAVPMMQFYLLACLRGEYCAEQLVTNDGGVLSSFLGTGDKPSAKKIKSWFAAKNAELFDIYGDVDRILCTGNEVYYKYLQDVIIPEYGLAKTGTRNWPVADLTSSAKGNMADGMAAYKDEKTGETGMGVISAVVRDFDGDNINDMLVLFLDKAPVGETAIREVYKNASTVVLRARLYTMQYNARPAAEVSLGSVIGSVLDQAGIQGILRTILEHIGSWAETKAASWRSVDRYTVYETASIELAAEFGGLCFGNLIAGIITQDGVPYLYTYEYMEDYTTYGPSISRIYHAEDGSFVFDDASGSVSWGQRTYVGQNAIDKYCGAKNTDFAYTLVGEARSLAAAGGSKLETDADPKLSQLKGSLLMRLRSFFVDGRPGHQTMGTTVEDFSFIRTVLEKNEAEALKLRGEEPVIAVPERPVMIDNTHKEEAKAAAESMIAAAGVKMTLSGESQPSASGSYWVRYASAKKTTLMLTIDKDGKITDIEVRGVMAERYGEWTTVKDAVLASDRLGLAADVQAVFRGGTCSAGERKDYSWGYILAGNMDAVFVMMHWN